MERAGKLTYIAHNYNLLHEEAHIEESLDKELGMEEDEDNHGELQDVTIDILEGMAREQEETDDDENLPLARLITTMNCKNLLKLLFVTLLLFNTLSPGWH